jgi:chemotaxis protein methyltransferase CheR
MNTADYDFLAEFLQKNSGLSLGQGKAYLLESRLMPIANSLGLNSLSELVRDLQRAQSQPLKTAVIEAMTTNETLFFRDKKPFDDLVERMLPTILKARAAQKKLRIWCAACSSGQEPYSIVMALREHYPQLQHEWNVEIIATDLNDQILAKAKSGIYTQFEVQRGLSIQMLMKYFQKSETGWQIKPDVRSWIQWRQLNLLDPFRLLGRFDVIFCRNVLIYFDPTTKKQILDRMEPMLESHGYLVLGGAETVLGICDSFRRAEGFQAAVYNPAHAGVGISGTAALKTR